MDAVLRGRPVPMFTLHSALVKLFVFLSLLKKMRRGNKGTLLMWADLLGVSLIKVGKNVKRIGGGDMSGET